MQNSHADQYYNFFYILLTLHHQGQGHQAKVKVKVTDHTYALLLAFMAVYIAVETYLTDSLVADSEL
jgi:hypothetical protein